LSEKSKCSKENEELRKALLTTEPQTSLPTVLETNNNTESTNNNLAFEIKKLQDRYSPDGQEDIATLKLSPNNFVSDEKLLKDETAKKEVESKCQQLEESLELMQMEFEKMEDYWQVSSNLM